MIYCLQLINFIKFPPPPLQLVAQYLSEYNVSSVSVSMYTPGQEEGVTVVTCSLELPEDAVDSVVRRYSGSRTKRNFVFSQEPVVYGFRPSGTVRTL